MGDSDEAKRRDQLTTAPKSAPEDAEARIDVTKDGDVTRIDIRDDADVRPGRGQPGQTGS